MSYKVSFLDNQVCGVDDFNSILADIANGGVVSEDFAGTEAYQMSKINVVTKGIVSQGVAISEKSLACTVKTEGVYIAPGFGIFGSGTKIKVTESELVSCDDVNNVYVYAYHDIRNNLAGFAANSEGFPAEVEGELYVLKLCQVVDSVFADKREYAKANIRVSDVVNAVKKMVMTVPTADYNKQEVVILNANDKTKLNFLIFLTTENIYIVEETSYGEFRIIKDLTGYTAESISTVDVISICNSMTSYSRIKNLKRDALGNICAEVDSDVPSSNYREYVLYASVYEEVSE